MNALRIIVIILLSTYNLSCGVQTAGSEVTEIEAEVSQNVETGTSSTLVLDASSMKGAKAEFPADAADAGTKLSLDNVTPENIPSDFEGLSSASAGGVNMKSESGAPLNRPASLSIPYNTGSLTLTADQTVENICVVVKTQATGDLYFWRHSALSLDTANTLAVVSTIFPGIYQLIYCGADDFPAGWKDATDPDAGGGKVHLQVNYLEADVSHAGATTICAMLMVTKSTEGPEVVGEKVIATTSQAIAGAGEIKLPYFPGEFSATEVPYIMLSGITADQSCPTETPGSALAAGPKGVWFYGFYLREGDLKDGAFQKTISDLASKTANIEIGTPDAAASSATAQPICIAGDDAENGFFARKTAITSSGGFTEGTTFIHQMPGTTGVTGILGSDCSDVFSETSNSSDPKRPRLVMNYIHTNNTFYLKPVSISVSAALTAVLAGQPEMCLAIFEGTGSLSADGKSAIVSIPISDISAVTSTLVPYTGANPVIDIAIVPSGCTSGGGSPLVTMEDIPLTDTISISN